MYEALGATDAQRLALLSAVQQWLKDNLAMFGDFAEDNGLSEYASIEFSEYPIERPSLNGPGKLRQEMAVPPGSLRSSLSDYPTFSGKA